MCHLPNVAIIYLFVCIQVEVQCEQLSRELARHREQLEREAQALKERLAEAREEGRTEARKHKEELAHTVNITYSHFVCMADFCTCVSFQSAVVVVLLFLKAHTKNHPSFLLCSATTRRKY